MSEARVQVDADPRNEAISAIRSGLGTVALLHEVQTDPRFGIPQEGDPMNEQARDLLNRLKYLDKAADTSLILQTTTESVFEHIIIPDFRASRTNRRGCSPERVEQRIAEITMLVQGVSYPEMAERLGRASSTGLQVNINSAFVNTMMKTYGPDRLNQRLTSLLEEGSWEVLQVRNASELAAVSRRPKLAGKPSEDTPRIPPERRSLTSPGSAEMDTLPPPRWENLHELPDDDWRKKIGEATAGLDDPLKQGIYAIMQNKTEGTLPAREYLGWLLSSRVGIRPGRVSQPTDLVSQLQYDTIHELTKTEDARWKGLYIPTAEDVAMKLFDRYEREETTFEDTAADALLLLAELDRHPDAGKA